MLYPWYGIFFGIHTAVIIIFGGKDALDINYFFGSVLDYKIIRTIIKYLQVTSEI